MVTRQRGFSVMELMVVLIIVGIVLAVAIPSIDSYSKSLGQKMATNQVIEDLRSARQRAVTQHTPMIVAFGNGTATTDITQYMIHTDTNGDGIVSSGEPLTTRKMPKDAVMTRVNLNPVDTLRFDVSGILKLGTKGGYIVVRTNATLFDTLMVPMTGVVYPR